MELFIGESGRWHMWGVASFLVAFPCELSIFSAARGGAPLIVFPTSSIKSLLLLMMENLIFLVYI